MDKEERYPEWLETDLSRRKSEEEDAQIGHPHRSQTVVTDSDRTEEIFKDVSQWAKLYKGQMYGDWVSNGHWYADIEFPDIRHATQFAYISALPLKLGYPDDHNVWPISAKLRDPVIFLDKPVIITVSKAL